MPRQWQAKPKTKTVSRFRGGKGFQGKRPPRLTMQQYQNLPQYRSIIPTQPTYTQADIDSLLQQWQGTSYIPGVGGIPTAFRGATPQLPVMPNYTPQNMPGVLNRILYGVGRDIGYGMSTMAQGLQNAFANTPGATNITTAYQKQIPQIPIVQTTTKPIKGFHPRGYHSAIVSQPGQANYSRVEGGQGQTQGVLENLIPGTEDLYYGGGVGGGGEYAYPASPFAAYRGGAAAQTQTVTPERQTLRNVLSNPSQYGTAGTQFVSRWNQLLTTWRL